MKVPRLFAYTCLVVFPICYPSERCAAQDTGNSRNIWKEVQKKAEEAGDRKALWRELKKLTAEELLVAGEQFCQYATELAKKQDGGDDSDTVIITVNAILHYHQTKTNYQATADVVGKIVAESETANWIYGAMEWIENNDHYKQIPSAGMKTIADGILRSLGNPKRHAAVQTVVLKKATSFKILSSITPEDRLNVLEACKRIAAEPSDDDRVKQARKSVVHIQKAIDEMAVRSR